ncbi:MAG TPA: Spy/CpxP family protein refolding chaperone [Polyangiaceae bacterium]|jgi:Spy/CpxP family protein refolding chaperone|nr:Spy/CpxP family protein refolding chaperone [Polyangiaceae bacterium]
MTSIARKIGLVATVLCGLAAAGACGGSSANRPPAASTRATNPAEDDVAEGLMEHHRNHHHGGVTLFIAMSLDTLGVSPEQEAAVERIRKDLHAKMEPARAAEQSMTAALADGLSAGTIDAVKVDAALAQVRAAAATAHEASVAALNELHSVLTPEQRGALVDKVEAHWAVWQRANAEETASDRPEGGHLATLAKDLALTDAQVAQIRSNLAEGMKAVPRLDPEEIATHLHAFGEAFRSNTFDAKSLTSASGADAHIVARGTAQMAHFVETVSPVLTPEQRNDCAQRLREHSSHNPSAAAKP